MARFKHKLFEYEYDTELDILLFKSGDTEPLLYLYHSNNNNYFHLLDNNSIEIDDDLVDEDADFFVNCLIFKLSRDGIIAKSLDSSIGPTIQIPDDAEYANFILKYNDFIFHY